jgi:hypothetical protein
MAHSAVVACMRMPEELPNLVSGVLLYEQKLSDGQIGYDLPWLVVDGSHRDVVRQLFIPIGVQVLRWLDVPPPPGLPAGAEMSFWSARAPRGLEELSEWMYADVPNCLSDRSRAVRLGPLVKHLCGQLDNNPTLLNPDSWL